MVVTKFLNIFKDLEWKHHKTIRLKIIKTFEKLNVLVTQGEADSNINPQVSGKLVERNGA
jgi:hypothetical protein